MEVIHILNQTLNFTFDSFTWRDLCTSNDVTRRTLLSFQMFNLDIYSLSSYFSHKLPRRLSIIASIYSRHVWCLSSQNDSAGCQVCRVAKRSTSAGVDSFELRTSWERSNTVWLQRAHWFHTVSCEEDKASPNDLWSVRPLLVSPALTWSSRESSTRYRWWVF